MSDTELVHRGRVLQRNEQLAQRTDHRSDQIPLPRPEFLLEFIRALVRNNPNGDILLLSILEAAKRTEATEDEVVILKAAIRELGSRWPKGFYSEL